MIPLLIDCDPGIDDAIAIALACRSAEVDLVAVTAAAGNMPVDVTYSNARRVLRLLDRPDIAVGRGPAAPLHRPLPPDPFSHGADGLGGMAGMAGTVADEPNPTDAAELICTVAHRHPGQLQIAALAPFTNLALALDLEPDLPRLVAGVAAIGGIFGVRPGAYDRATGGNPMSEWNVFVDPEAADRVFRAGFDLTAVGLDVATDDANDLGQARRARLALGAGPVAELANGILGFLDRRGHGSYCALIDSLAIVAIVAPALIRTVDVLAAVELDGTITRGMVVTDHRRNFAWSELPRIKAVADVDFAAALDLIVDRLVGPAAGVAT